MHKIELNKEFIIGKLKEEHFKIFLDNPISATREEDIYKHFDLKIELKIDVKSLKKTNRNDNSYNENIHWIELRNVNGQLGWLYGEADLFAFETFDYWIIIDKIKLQNFIEKKCKGKQIEQSKEFYTLYRRKNRRDTIVKIKTFDLFFLSNKIISKNNFAG